MSRAAEIVVLSWVLMIDLLLIVVCLLGIIVGDLVRQRGRG